MPIVLHISFHFLSATRQSKQFVSKQMNAFDTHALFVCNKRQTKQKIPNHVSKNLNSFLINLIIQSALTHMLTLVLSWKNIIGHTLSFWCL